MSRVCCRPWELNVVLSSPTLPVTSHAGIGDSSSAREAVPPVISRGGLSAARPKLLCKFRPGVPAIVLLRASLPLLCAAFSLMRRMFSISFLFLCLSGSSLDMPSSVGVRSNPIDRVVLCIILDKMRCRVLSGGHSTRIYLFSALLSPDLIVVVVVVVLQVDPVNFHSAFAFFHAKRTLQARLVTSRHFSALVVSWFSSKFR